MINCLIIDDEPLALDILESHVRKTPFLSLKGRCNGVTDALLQMQNERIDLLFLDIQMPEINGLEFSKVVGDKVKIIFTTAFDQYAIDGFKVNALAYLLKPFSYSEFLEAVTRAKGWFDLTEKASQQPAQSDAKSLFVKSEYKIIKIDFDEILYIEGLKDYAKFFLTGKERPIMSIITLKALEEKLPASQFMRVHRSFIVNLDKIKTIQRNEILFDKVSIVVADKYKDAFHEFVKSKFLE